ncbi:MAG: twin-arginine translocase subunit TatC [Halobacteria archaeon]|nr:twin-arginine translocase subunit TatC [Halobacteria archaeon]
MADESTRELIYTGLADVTDEIRQRLLRIVLVFLVGMLATIFALRWYIFGMLREDALRLVYQNTDPSKVKIIFLNPFEVILLQAKLGIFVGILFALPLAIYYARKPLRERGIWPQEVKYTNKQVIALLVGGVVFFVFGVIYAYYIMIPYFFQFVVDIALQQDISPNFRISKFVMFIILYTVIFGFIAELPLIMVFTVKTGITSYSFYRSKWRHFAVISAILGAAVTSPDPITQTMVAGPMLGIYIIGLGVLRVVAAKEIREEKRMRERLAPKEEKEESGLIESLTSSVTGGESNPNPTTENPNPSANESVSAPKSLEDRGLVDVASSIVDALKSKSIRIGAFFLVVTSIVFYWMLYYGIETIRDQTVSFMTPDLRSHVVIVMLQPFEMLYLIVKISLIAGILSTVPLIIYYSRHALISEGIIKGDGSRFYYVSRGLVVAGLFLGGVVFAYFGIIPVLISILSESIVESGMLANYTIQEFVQFVLMISLLFGVLAQMPSVMYFLVSSKVTRYDTLKRLWRHFTVVSFALGAIVTSTDPFTMIIVAVPLSGFYLISLGITRVLCHGTIKEVRRERRMLGLVEDGGRGEK